jgi:16S rRNA processing protein RimM
VGRAHGLDGSFYVTRPDADLLRDGVPISIAGSVREVVRRSGTAAKPIIRVEGVSTREAVEALRGEAILVDRSYAPPLDEDEWWADDLVGLDVVDGTRPVGVVERVMTLPSCDVLEVGDLLIPLVDDAVRSVDLEARRVDVDLAFLGDEE